MIKCDEFSCVWNIWGDCENDYLVMEEKKCQCYESDDGKCEECGWTLAEVRQKHEYWGRIVEEVGWVCPNCKA